MSRIKNQESKEEKKEGYDGFIISYPLFPNPKAVLTTRSTFRFLAIEVISVRVSFPSFVVF